MKRIRFSLLLLVAVIGFSTLFYASDCYNMTVEAAPSLAENKNTVKTLESDLKDTQATLDAIKANINKAKQGQADQLYIKNQLDQEITYTEKKIETLEALIQGYTDQISEKEKEIDGKADEIDKLHDIVGQRLVMQHESMSGNILSYILGSSDFSDFLSRIEIVNELLNHDKNLMQKLSNEKASLATAKDELTATRTKCEESIAELKTAKSEIEEKIVTATNYLAAYKQDEAIYQQQYNAKASEMEAIEKEIKEILAQIELQERTNYSNEEFRFPLPYDATYWNTGGFGWRVWSNGRQTDYHKGVDFAAARGTPILATNSGTVILKRNSPSYGLYLIIDHGGGVTSLYAHCSKLLVELGDKVTKGDKIAEVGSTGDSTGNHLHFSMLENGVHVDPMKYIKEP